MARDVTTQVATDVACEGAGLRSIPAQRRVPPGGPTLNSRADSSSSRLLLHNSDLKASRLKNAHGVQFASQRGLLNRRLRIANRLLMRIGKVSARNRATAAIYARECDAPP